MGEGLVYILTSKTSKARFSDCLSVTVFLRVLQFIATQEPKDSLENQERAWLLHAKCTQHR